VARPAGSPNKDKPFREAIRMEALLAEKGEDCTATNGSLRRIARALLERACLETAAAKEIGDRLDGRPAQAIIGGDDDDPAVKIIGRIERVIVDTPAKD
jgi:hypothetical protein